MKQASKMFKALADETRLRILALLLSQGEQCVCDIMAALQLPQSTVSRHMAYLRTSGWVDDRRMGLWVYYKVSAEGTTLQRDLAQLLLKYLPEFGVATGDRDRLASSSDPSRCG